MGIDFFFGAGTYFFARQREKFFWCFFGVFLVFLLFFGGVFVLFWCFFCFSRAARIFFFGFSPPAVTFFFSRGREQNAKFPL